MHDEEQTERHQRDQVVSRKICTDIVEISETYTYPVKTMTGVRSTI